MAKHFIFLIVISIVAIFFRTEVAYVIHGAINLHDKLVAFLSLIFSGGKWGQLIKLGLALFVLPVFFGGLIAGIYWLFKRIYMPYTMEVIWILWFVLLTALALQGS
jgi:hypothetical protein